MLILYYDILHTRKKNNYVGEYWTISPDDARKCYMINDLVEIEYRLVIDKKHPTKNEMYSMNQFYKNVLFSQKVIDYLHNV